MGDGEQGPLEVEAAWTRVRTKDVNRRIGPEERLIAIKAVGETRVDYALAEAVRAQRKRHRNEEARIYHWRKSANRFPPRRSPPAARLDPG